MEKHEEKAEIKTEEIWENPRLEESKSVIYRRKLGDFTEAYRHHNSGVEEWFMWNENEECVYAARKEPGKEKIIWINKLNGE